jgi:hypothetical protein
MGLLIVLFLQLQREPWECTPEQLAARGLDTKQRGYVCQVDCSDRATVEAGLCDGEVQ